MNDKEEIKKSEETEVKEFVDGSNLNMFSKSTKSFILKNMVSGVIQLDLSSNHMDEECSKLLAAHLASPDCTIRSLSVTFCHLTHKCSTIIFSSIGDSPLYEFYADNNIISVENCISLSSSLAKDPPLELLSLVGCQINSDGFLQLFTGLPKSSHIHHLRFDSNSMLDSAAVALSDLIPILKLQSLGISDNEIWRDGTTAIIQSCIQRDTIYSLDIGYNIVDFGELSGYIRKSDTLHHLGVSGSKIYEEQLNSFLITVGSESHISRLLIEDINFYHMPITWGIASENAFGNQSHLESLLAMMNSSRSLEDIRIGFLDLDQLQLLYENAAVAKREGRTSWHFVLSLTNFGKTGNTWLIRFPNFLIESPLPYFEWNSKIVPTSNLPSMNFERSQGVVPMSGPISMLSFILNNAKFNGERLKVIKFSNTKMNDECFSKLFNELNHLFYQEFDLSSTDLRNGSIEALIEFLRCDGAYVERIILKNTRASPNAYQALFQFFNENPKKVPKVIIFRFECPKLREELSVLDFSSEIGRLLGKNPPLEELRLGGQITGKDAINIVSFLKTNHHLRHFEMQSDLFDRYHSADPDIDENLIAVFNDFVEILHNDLMDDDTQCILEEFTFPLLTELFLGYIPNIKLWPFVVKQLDTNYNTNNDIQTI